MELQNRLVVGLDLSLNSTGVTIFGRLDDKEWHESYIVTPHKFVRHFFVQHKEIDCKDKEMHKVLRYEAIADEIVRLISEACSDNCKLGIVAVEGIAYGSRFSPKSTSSNIYDLSALNAHVRYRIYKEFANTEKALPDFEIRVITPLSVKKQFTGNGKAKKYDMYLKYMEIVGHEPLSQKEVDKEQKHEYDIADSFALAYITK